MAALMYRPVEFNWEVSSAPAAEQAEIPLHFGPSDWSDSDAVQVHFGWRRMTVIDRRLKGDPRPNVDVLLPDTATSLEVIPVCEFPGNDLTVALIVFAEQDIQPPGGRGPWLVHPDVASCLPAELSGLAEGYGAGIRGRSAGGPLALRK